MDAVTTPHLSWSRISTWRRCGEQYRLRYIEQVPPEPSGAMIGGSAVHATIAEAEEREWWRDSALWSEDGVAIAWFLADLDRRLAEAGDGVRWGGRKTREFPGGEDRTWWERSGPMMLRRYAALRRDLAEEGWGLVEGGAEMQVTVPLDDLPPLLGFVDAFLAHASGEPVILDWKTGQVGRADVMQLATYAWLIARARGITVERGALVYLRATDRARQMQQVDLRPLVPHVEETVRAAARGIAEGIWVPNPGPMCVACSVRAGCWYGATLDGEEE